MKTPKTLYILIAVFCVFAIIAGIYAQFIEGNPKNTNKIGDTTVVKDRETIKKEFYNLFTDTLNLNGYDTTGIVRINANKEIVYPVEREETTDTYEINIHIPVINIKGDVANSFNKVTQAVFANKVNDVLRNKDANSKTLYSVDYVAYINGDILSVAIKSTLKEGDNAQRVMVQTYNYNLLTNTEVKLSDVITQKAYNKDEVNSKIKQIVKEADDESKAIASAGYNEVYSRNLDDNMYLVDNSSIFLLGPDSQLYIIYAYGNQNFTSEMDIIVF